MAPKVKKDGGEVQAKTDPLPNVIKSLLDHQAVLPPIHQYLKQLDLEGELNKGKILKNTVKCIEDVLSADLTAIQEQAATGDDPFDKLLKSSTNHKRQTSNEHTDITDRNVSTEGAQMHSVDEQGLSAAYDQGDTVEEQGQSAAQEARAANEQGKETVIQSQSDPLSRFSFCLFALKLLAADFPDSADLLLLKFKNILIRCVVKSKLSDSLKNEASLICERLMERTNFIEESDEGLAGRERWMGVMLWLMRRAMREGASRSDIKRVRALHKLLPRYVLTPTSPSIDTLKQVVTSMNFLHYKEGRQTIAQLLSLNKSLVVPFNNCIKKALPEIVDKSKAQACFYGEVFNTAWNNALPQVKQELEEEVFQKWMEIYLKMNRTSKLSHGPVGKTIFHILSHLHNSRRLIALSSSITRLYQPIIWRSLTSHLALERCNAAELFLDVFPMEKPECGKVENSNFKERQFKQIMDLLKDESHITRIVTIRGLVQVFKDKMECLTVAQCRTILSWLANDLANDGSSYLVRVAVWDFFSALVSFQDPHGFLITLLPQMSNHFHDRAEQVRKSFAKMLLNISSNPQLDIHVTSVAPYSHIIARLALEGEGVGRLLCKLIMGHIYTEGMSVTDLIKKLKMLVYQCPQAAQNLLRWSTHVLSVKDAYFIILTILVYLRSYTKSRVENRPDGSGKSTCITKQGKGDKAGGGEEVDTGQEGVENVASLANSQPTLPSPSSSPAKKKNKKSIEPPPRPSIRDKKDNDSFDIDGPTAEVHSHLLSCAHVLWIVFSTELQKNPTYISELNTVVTACLQNYLRCYKGTPAWYSSLSLASLVPLTKLNENTTASSTCLAELRRTDTDTPFNQTEALIYSLAAWNRGYEVIELATDYIDPVFKIYHLNSSSFLIPRESGGRTRGRVVKFAKDKGKEMIGLRLLSLLFYDYHNEMRLLLKHYDRVHELFTYLEGIKVILEGRFAEEHKKDMCSVSDEFLVECFQVFVGLVSVLERKDPSDSISPPFSASNHMTALLSWALRVFVPHLKDAEVPDESEEAMQHSHESNDEEEEEEVESELEDKPRRANKKNKKRKKKEENKVTKVKSVSVKVKGRVDVVVSCLKALINETCFMIKTKLTDQALSHAAANFALTLINSDRGKLWFLEDCLEIVESLSEYAWVWQPKDDDHLLSVVCPSLYSHVLLAITNDIRLTESVLQAHNINISRLKRKLMCLPNTLQFVNYGGSSTNEILTKVFSSIIESCVSAIHAQALRMETIEEDMKMDDLPLGVVSVTQAILIKPKLVPLILTHILDFAHNNEQEGILLVCAVSYLYSILGSYKKKFDVSEIETTIQELYQLFNSLSPVQKNGTNQDELEDEDSFFADPLAEVNCQKVGTELLRKISRSVNCQLVSVPFPFHMVPRRSVFTTPRSVKAPAVEPHAKTPLLNVSS